MALARVQYEADGSTDTFSVTFPYLEKDDVKVSLDGTETSAYSWASSSSIKLDSTPTSGTIIDIVRETERTNILVDFQDGSTLLESDLDLAARQSFYLAQESFDQTGSTLAVANDGSYSANGRRISALEDPNSDDDAATQGYVKSVLSSGEDAAEMATEAENWANYPEDSLVPEGDGVDDYSSLHHKSKSQAAQAASETARDDSQAARDASQTARDDSQAARDAAQTAESEAKTARDAAQTAQSGAETAESNTQALLDDFENRYWGPASSEPSTDANGNGPNTGDLYFNTTEDQLKIYDGAAWVDAVETQAAVVTVTAAGNISSTDVQAALEELDSEKVHKTSDTGSAKLPSGTTAQRPGSPQAGYMRFNTDTGLYEGYTGSEWVAVGSGAKGSAGDQIFVENDQIVTADYTIPGDKNAMSTGPITVSDGVTVTVSDGARWVVI